MNITLFGAGAWGTALAIALAERHDVVLWGRDEAAMREMAARRENLPYLPNIQLPARLSVTAEFSAAVASGRADGESLWIVASSMAGFRPILRRLQQHAVPNLIWLCKGFEEKTLLLPHQVAQEELGDRCAIGALSGPSFAQEVAAGLPCALTIASDNAALRDCVVSAIHGRTMRVYASDDVVGVEVGGAAKNILAIATGVIDGLGLGLNARAALMTRGLVEIMRLGNALGGRSETLMGLTGMGDLILTCTGNLSRNRSVGLGLAQGKTLGAVVAELGHVAEGVHCARAVRELSMTLGIEMPITHAVAGILFDGDSPQAMVNRLLSRDPRDETI